jgi:hypothetical protein
MEKAGHRQAEGGLADQMERLRAEMGELRRMVEELRETLRAQKSTK